MIKNIFSKTAAALFSFVILVSCSDSSDDLNKEKEMRLIRQYLESKNINAEPKASGLYFISTQEGSGAKAKLDNWVVISYTARLINDRIFDTTDEGIARSNNIFSTSLLYGTRRLNVATLAIKGVQEGLVMMREGGRATLIIPSHLGFGSSGTAAIPGYSTLVYDIELIRVIDNPEVYEKELIDNYILLYNDSTHLVVTKKESGLYYIELLEGTGEDVPADSERVSVFYHGTLTDGRVFDSNIGGSVFRFNIGSNQTIAGFEEAIKHMTKAGRARAVIPSSLGYGPEGSGAKIVGYTPLVFDLELVNIEE
jgi:FKBP-type peptidyl-prolyl cis-trans isomerase FkpA